MSGLVSSITPQDNFHVGSAYQQGGLEYSQGQLQNTQEGQQVLAHALLAQSQGQGINLAQAQLNQATDQNMKQNAGFVASQKGLSPALAARMAAQNQAGMSQQAAQQGAILAGQQQLNSQNQLAGVFNNMAGTDVQNSQIMQGGINTANEINAGVAKTNASNAAAIEGGLISAGGAVGAKAMSTGGKIPGHALVHGNSPKNDTVPTMLSPGEIVIPRSAATSLEKAKAFIEKIKAEKNPKLTGESEEHYQLAHPDGTKFHVAKKGISPKLQAQLEAMKEPQKLFDGGMAAHGSAGDSPPSDPADDITPALESVGLGPKSIQDSQTQDQMALAEARVAQNARVQGVDQSGLKPQDPDFSDPGVAQAVLSPAKPQDPNRPLAPTGPDTPQEALPQNAFASFGQTPDYSKTLDERKRLYDQMGQNQASGLERQAKLYQQQGEDLKRSAELENQVRQEMTQKSDQLFNAMQSKAIDPNRFWASKTTGNKIGTMISMVLGGIGAGMQHSTNNLALGVINKQIDNDIDAQKADMGKQQNLFRYNMEKYQNEVQAIMATRSQLLTATQAQAQSLAAKDGSAQAILNYKLMSNQITLQQQQIQSSLATNQVKHALSSGGVPEAYEGALRNSPALKDVPMSKTGGRVYQAVSKEAAEEQRQLEPLAGTVVDHLNELRGMGAEALATPEGRAKADVLRGQLLADLPKLKSVEVGGKRIPESEIELAKDYLGDPKNFMQYLTAGHRNDFLFNSLINEVEAKRHANLVGYKSANELIPGAQKGWGQK